MQYMKRQQGLEKSGKFESRKQYHNVILILLHSYSSVQALASLNIFLHILSDRPPSAICKFIYFLTVAQYTDGNTLIIYVNRIYTAKSRPSTPKRQILYKSVISSSMFLPFTKSVTWFLHDCCGLPLLLLLCGVHW